MAITRATPLISTQKLVIHQTRNIIWGLIFILLALGAGMWGYRGFEGMSWIDAFLNASMILGGMGPVSTLNTDGGKIFAGIYALFSGLAFIALMALVFSPVIRHFFHRIHIEASGNE